MKKQIHSIIIPLIGLMLLFGNTATAAGIKAGDYTIAANGDQSLSISYKGRDMFRLLGVETESFTPKVSMAYAFFKFEKENPNTRALTIQPKADGVTLLLDGKDAGAITFQPAETGSLRVIVSVSGPGKINAVRLKFACGETDRFWGFGEQYNYIDLRGQNLKIWTQEQGVGRAENPPAIPPGRGSFTDTYFPMPYFMDPAQGKGFLVENMEFNRFDVCAADPAEWTVEVWDTHAVIFRIFPGPKPADVLMQLTAAVGRPKRTPPDWAFGGVWLAAQGGSEPVRARLDKALAAGIPVSAVWVQDWLGKRQFVAGNWGVKHRWVPDLELYPDLEKMIKDMRAKGVRFLGYFNPYILPDYEHFKPGAEKGYLVKNQIGAPYTWQIITFPGGMLDVTNQEAVQWFQSYARKATDMGMAGWMCDYGEALPYDSLLLAGDGPKIHNIYPTIWHQMNKEILESAYPDGDYVLLTRSGYTYEQRVAQIVWAADQEQDWKDEDGMPTVVRAGLTLGLSGIPYFSLDIAGFSGGPSDKELFLRWTELGAFAPVMRTHDGLKKKENHRFDSGAETLAHFTKFARIHAALLPYWKAVAGEAVSIGLPMIRHTVLVDPDWDPALEAHTQWMLGNDLLFAPVTTQGASEIKVWFPAGEWEHLLTGEKFQGRAIATVPAPIGTPAVFVRAGKMEDIVKQVREIVAP